MAAETHTQPGRLTLLARRSWAEYLTDRQRALTQLVEAHWESTSTAPGHVQLELVLEEPGR